MGRIYSGPECEECGHAPLIEGHSQSCSQAHESDAHDPWA